MNGTGSRMRVGVVLLALMVVSVTEVQAQAPPDGEALVARLVRPDHQAAEFLALFQGARWPDPAAALAAWKKGARQPGALGKPLEAAIAVFNPEMIREWRVMDGAELRVGLDPIAPTFRWYAIIPRDDGTLAAALTASRLTYPDDPPIAVDGRDIPVARLGRSGLPLGCQVGPILVVGGSREELLRGASAERAERTPPPGFPESGIVFFLAAGKLVSPRDASLGMRRTVEALHAAGCRRVDGRAHLQDGRLILEVTTTLDRPPQGVEPVSPAVDPAWLELLPCTNTMAMVSLAIHPDSSSLDQVFTLADRVERMDPARAGLAPLRTRLNLLGTAAGLKLEKDLWPHLRGISACVVGDSSHPGPPTGALLVLHLDEPLNAQELMRESLPRIGKLLGRRPGEAGGVMGRQEGQHEAKDAARGPQRIAMVSGRPITAWQRDREICVAWCDETIADSWRLRDQPGRSLGAACGGWAIEGRKAPQRVGAIWPGRLWRMGGVPEPSAATLRVLAEDPPMTWWGWSEGGQERDLVRWPGLRERVRKLLETLPIDPARP